MIPTPHLLILDLPSEILKKRSNKQQNQTKMMVNRIFPMLTLNINSQWSFTPETTDKPAQKDAFRCKRDTDMINAKCFSVKWNVRLKCDFLTFHSQRVRSCRVSEKCFNTDFFFCFSRATKSAWSNQSDEDDSDDEAQNTEKVPDRSERETERERNDAASYRKQRRLNVSSSVFNADKLPERSVCEWKVAPPVDRCSTLTDTSFKMNEKKR